MVAISCFSVLILIIWNSGLEFWEVLLLCFDWAVEMCILPLKTWCWNGGEIDLYGLGLPLKSWALMFSIFAVCFFKLLLPPEPELKYLSILQARLLSWRGIHVVTLPYCFGPTQLCPSGCMEIGFWLDLNSNQALWRCLSVGFCHEFRQNYI